MSQSAFSRVCPVCGALMQSNAGYFDCPYAGQAHGQPYKPHHLNPFTERETKIRTRDKRVTAEQNVQARTARVA